MGADVGHASLANLQPADLAQLVRGLLLGDAVHDKAALGVIDQAEVLVGLVQVDHVHDAGGVGHVGLDLAVDLDQALLQDLLHLLAGQGVPGRKEGDGTSAPCPGPLFLKIIDVWRTRGCTPLPIPLLSLPSPLFR